MRGRTEGKKFERDSAKALSQAGRYSKGLTGSALDLGTHPASFPY
jgi:hypothetical protein